MGTATLRKTRLINGLSTRTSPRLRTLLLRANRTVRVRSLGIGSVKAGLNPRAELPSRRPVSAPESSLAQWYSFAFDKRVATPPVFEPRVPSCGCCSYFANTAANRGTRLFLVGRCELVTPRAVFGKPQTARNARRASRRRYRSREHRFFFAFKFLLGTLASGLVSERTPQITPPLSTLYHSAASNKKLTICSLFLRIAHIKIIRKVVIRSAVNVYR
jgi:hypothetical protein